MDALKTHPTLKDFQEYVKALEIERGFAHQDVISKCLMLGEEVGELFKSIRKTSGMSIDEKSKVSSVADEMADIIIMLCSVANRTGVDLEEAFRNKEKINANRKWT
jgi:NTP pyrophosphatase (non-canonical NTP hydrolase)